MKEATLCYLERDGKYLMLFRNKKPNDPNEGKWIGVGGKPEPGETPEQCAKREIYEETGLTARELVRFGTVTFLSDVWEAEIMHLFWVTEFEGELSECSEGELHWIEKERIFDLPLWDGDRIFLQYMFSGKPFSEMTLRYRGDRLAGCVVDGAEVELIDVDREDGSPAGYVSSRDFVHWHGLWHTTVHVWIVGESEAGKPALLLQFRAAGKRLYPSHWDISSAGHIPVGEDALQAALREVEEELGILPAEEEMEDLGTIVVTYDDDDGEGYHDREFCRMFLLRRNDPLSAFTLQPSEVERVMWIPFDELNQRIHDGTLRHCLDLREIRLLTSLFAH